MAGTGRRLTACILVCSLATPLWASVFAPGEAAGNAPCAQSSRRDGSCPGAAMLASADELAAIGLAAQPVLDSVPRAPAAAHPGGHTASAIMLNEIASLFVSDRSSGASADSAAPVVFWVFGSGLLGAAFVARRRKPARSKS